MKFWRTELNRKYGELAGWIGSLVEEGHLSRAQESAITRATLDIFAASGLPPGPDADEMSAVVFRHMYHTMKRMAGEVCPHLMEEIRHYPERDCPFMAHPAYAEVDQFRRWLQSRCANYGIPARKDYRAILQAGWEAYAATGQPRGPLADQATVAALNAQKEALVSRAEELCPGLLAHYPESPGRGR